MTSLATLRPGSRMLWALAAACVLLSLLTFPSPAAAQDAGPAVLPATDAPERDDLVIGGESIAGLQAPFLIGVNDRGFSICSSVYLGRGWLITAKHCVQGRSTLFVETEVGVVFSVLESVPHSSLDVALIRTDMYRNAPHVGYHGVPLDSSQVMAGLIVGRGASEPVPGIGTDGSGYPRRAAVQILPDSQCRAIWGTGFDPGVFGCVAQAPHAIDGVPPGRGCFGDSGGAVIVDRRLAGVVVAGSRNCDTTPALFVDLPAIGDWVESVTDVPPMGTRIDQIRVPDRDASSGYWLAALDGSLHAFGAADNAQAGGPRIGVVDVAADPSGRTLYTLDEFGGIAAPTVWGESGHRIAPIHGEPRGQLAAGEQATTIASTSTGDGYWVATSRGRVFAYGDATHHGDVGHLDLAAPVIDMAVTPSGNGYWLLGADGGIFAFGDAGFHGSIPEVLPGVPLACPVNGIVASPSGQGYWLTACDGGVFAFGDAPFVGSIPGLQRAGGVLDGVQLAAPIVGMVPFGDGYVMVASDGGVFNFSSQEFSGSLGGTALRYPIVAIAAFTRD